MNRRQLLIRSLASIGLPVVGAAVASAISPAAQATCYFSILDPVTMRTHYYQRKGGEIKKGWPIDVWYERNRNHPTEMRAEG